MFTNHTAFAASSDLRHATPACHCAAYPFAHLAGHAECTASFSLVRRGAGADCKERIELEELCESCGLPPADLKEVDFGIGSYEFWGQRCTHTDWRTVSSCCEADLVKNTAEAAARCHYWRYTEEKSNA